MPTDDYKELINNLKYYTTIVDEMFDELKDAEQKIEIQDESIQDLKDQIDELLRD